MIEIKSKVESWLTPLSAEERLKHIERAGRVCYKSEDKITEGSAAKLIKGILKRGHLSVLEHGNIIIRPMLTTYQWADRLIDKDRKEGFYSHMRLTKRGGRCLMSGNVRAWHDFLRRRASKCDTVPADIAALLLANKPLFADIDPQMIVPENTDTTEFANQPELFFTNVLPPDERIIHGMATLRFVVDRGVSHELVRHRTLSFSQESTRYCNYSSNKFGHELTFVEPEGVEHGSKEYATWVVACLGVENSYFSMIGDGATPQKARSVLNNSVKTEVVVSGHYNDWLAFLSLRTAPDAHPDMQRVAKEAGKLLYAKDKEIFKDYGGEE